MNASSCAVHTARSAKAIFPTDDSIRKVVYLSIQEITKKWTMPVRDWGLCYSQIMVFFADRFAA